MRALILLLIAIVFYFECSSQKEIEVLSGDGVRHKIILSWNDPDIAPKWQLMVLSPGFLVTDNVAITNRFELVYRPIPKLDIQARVMVPYAKKVDFGREEPVNLTEYTKSTLQSTLKIGYNVLSKDKEKIRSTVVGASGNVSYVAKIPRTMRNSLQVVGGFDYLRTPSSFQIIELSYDTDEENGSDKYFCINTQLANLLGGLAFTREQSYGVNLDGEVMAFASKLKAYFLLAGNISHSTDFYLNKHRFNNSNEELTDAVEVSTNNSVNDLVTFKKDLGVRMGVDYLLSRPNAPIMNTFSCGLEIATMPYYMLNANTVGPKGYLSIHFGYGIGQRLGKSNEAVDVNSPK